MLIVALLVFVLLCRFLISSAAVVLDNIVSFGECVNVLAVVTLDTVVSF